MKKNFSHKNSRILKTNMMTNNPSYQKQLSKYGFKTRFFSLGFLIILSVFSLSGCFSFGGGSKTEGNSQQTVSDTSKVYETQNFSIVIPKDWEIIEKKDFTSDIPRETVVVFRSNVKNETFTPTVAIVKKDLLDPVTSLEYGKLVHNRQNLGLVDFKQISEETIKFKKGNNEEETLFRVYEGRKGEDEKMVHYQETYATKDNTAYVIVGGTSPRENDTNVQTVGKIVKSFQLK